MKPVHLVRDDDPGVCGLTLSAANDAGVPCVISAETFAMVATFYRPGNIPTTDATGVKLANAYFQCKGYFGRQPIGIAQRAEDGSLLVNFVASREWTEDRLRGHVSVVWPDLEAEFGTACQITIEGTTARVEVEPAHDD